MEYKDFCEDEKNKLKEQVDKMSDILNACKDIHKSIPDDNEIILLGECTHGTNDFYEVRANITKQMIQKGYRVILLEAEWPDIIILNNYIQGRGLVNNINQAFSHITKFPVWMWKNKVIFDLIEWMKNFNLENPDNMIYCFGIDCQQFLKSMQFVTEYLKAHNHEFYNTTYTRLAIFRQFITESQYATTAVYGALKNMVPNIINNLQNLLSTFQWEHVDSFIENPDISLSDKIDRIACEQSFEIIVNGEEYFRKMLEEPSGSQASWNTRDQHMLMTIMRIRNRFSQINDTVPKIIVWAHNSHIGNSLATSRGGDTFTNNNTWNLGQMVKEMFNKSINIGFYTHQGKVVAGEKDKKVGVIQDLNNSHPLSYEYLFHNVCMKNNLNFFWLDLRSFRISKQIESNYTYSINEKYRDIYTGEIFVAKNIFQDNNKLIYLLDDKNKKHLFINPYSTITKKCRLLNSFNYDNLKELFNGDLLQRWIGVNYIKETEMDSHYGESKLATQYDFVYFINKTDHLE